MDLRASTALENDLHPALAMKPSPIAGTTREAAPLEAVAEADAEACSEYEHEEDAAYMVDFL